MSQPSPKRKLDDLLTSAVDLRGEPDFAQWRQEHPEAIEALRAIPAIIARRRYATMRVVRYSTSAAAALLVVIVATWWMFFGHGAERSWAAVIDQLAKIQTAACSLTMYGGGFAENQKVYLDGHRLRLESSGAVTLFDFQQGKAVHLLTLRKEASIHSLKDASDGEFAIGSNPLDDLIQMKNAPAERLPDEKIDDTTCRVYRVKDTSFLGFKVPWVKVWLDPQTGLPIQVHSMILDGRMTWTLTDFHWNEPFDKGLTQVVMPEGYELVVPPGKSSASEAAPERSTGMTSETMNAAQQGREIPFDEIAKTLDMLAERAEQNYKKMATWNGTYDLAEEATVGPERVHRVTHAAIDFFAEPAKDRIRIDYREVEPTKFTDNHYVTAGPLEARWIRTPEYLLRFPVSQLRDSIEGFPRIEGLRAPFRVLYREPSKAAEQYTAQGYIDPLCFFGNDHERSWQTCRRYADTIRGKRGTRPQEDAKRYLTLHQRRKGEGTEYVLDNRYKPSGNGSELIFSTEAGYNLTLESVIFSGQPVQTQEFTFRKERDVFIPQKVEFKQYYEQEATAPKSPPAQHRLFTLTKSQVNEPIDPAVFEATSLALREGDRMVDWIEHRMMVFDGKQFVPADKFKPETTKQTAIDNGKQAHVINNMRTIALALHNYHDANRTLPPAYKADKEGKPLLSWRVLILPFVEEDALYKEFHLDEPWDSEHNKTLIARMPDVYKSPASKVSGEGKTNYLTVRGPQSVFPGQKAVNFAQIPDGMSKTIMTVEVDDDRAVIWTKPDDFQYDPNDPMKGLGGLWPGGFIAGFADGAVRFLWSTIDAKTLDALFTRNGKEPVETDGLGR